MSDKLSLIMPCFNGGKTIFTNLSNNCRLLRSTGKPFEIIFVDDGSTDNTLAEAKKVRCKCLRIISYKPNHGKGYALKTGFKNCTGELVSFVDADNDLPIGQLKVFLRVMEKKSAGIVIGSKRHPLSRVHYPRFRRLLSLAYSCLIRLLFNLNVSDTQVGMKLFRYPVLEAVLPKVLVKKYAFDLELLVNANEMGFRIFEAPVVIKYRFRSHVDPKAVWNIFVDTLAIAYRLHILKFYDRRRPLSYRKSTLRYYLNSPSFAHTKHLNIHSTEIVD